MQIAERIKPDEAHLIHFADGQAIRNEIARAVPTYEGIQHLRKTGDQVQWGGERLCEKAQADGTTEPHFATPNGRARFSVVAITPIKKTANQLRLSTRRGKQFNSIVQRDRDPLNGAAREDILISETDALRLNLKHGDAIRMFNEVGEMHGRAFIAPLTPGNLQAHWPEANVLLKRGQCDDECGIPDYNAVVEIEAA